MNSPFRGVCCVPLPWLKMLSGINFPEVTPKTFLRKERSPPQGGVAAGLLQGLLGTQMIKRGVLTKHTILRSEPSSDEPCRLPPITAVDCLVEIDDGSHHSISDPAFLSEGLRGGMRVSVQLDEAGRVSKIQRAA